MNRKLITTIKESNVFLLSDDKVSFFVNLPKSSNASIVLNMINDVNLTSSDIGNVEEEVSKIYNSFSLNDVALVVPILDSNLCEQIKLNNDIKVFEYTDTILSYLININYKLLSNSNINVNSIVEINNNLEYEAFNKWFVDKYQGRVVLADYNKSVSPSNPFDDVVSQVNDDNEDKKLASDVLDSTSTINVIKEDDVVPVDDVRDPGFVSYVLLGVLVAVISLVALYMLL